MPNTVRSGFHTFLSLALLALAPLSSFAQSTSSFNLPAQPLAESLRAVGAQLNLNVMVSPALVDGKQAPALKARASAKDALTRLLAGTGLEYHFVNDQTVVIREKGAAVAVKDPLAGQVTEGTVQDTKKEDGKKSSQDFRVAQASPGSAQGHAQVEKEEEQKGKKKFVLEEIVVTGSRIPTVPGRSAQDVKTYTREQIDQSGQSTVATFLATLPDVSVAVGENGVQTAYGGTTVQLHGLPQGTTLVLIDGRRLETSGAQVVNGFNFFDLNSIPVAAVDRIEVLSQGSSAVYGSDAIAGVVNIILRKDFVGLEVNGKYGGSSGTNEGDANLTWGQQWNRGGFSVTGSYQTRTELQGFDRAITATNDWRAFGGADARSFECNPGNVFSIDGSNLPGVGAPYAAVPVGFTGAPTQQEFATTAGTLNRCSLSAFNSVIPATHRTGVLGQGHIDLTSSVQLFTELMWSYVQELQEQGPPGLAGEPGFQNFTVSASNPYNPFGESVGVTESLTSVGRVGQHLDTEFFRPLVGAKSNVHGGWDWEIAAWQSQDKSHLTQPNFPNNGAIQGALDATNPSAALNPFVSGPPASSGLLQSLLFNEREEYVGKTQAVNGFIRGSAFNLPSGPINVVFGAEWDRDTLSSDLINNPFFPPNSQSTFHRTRYAAFGETRVPILAKHSSEQSGETLAATVAARYDHYSDFGDKTTPQYGLEWRPFAGLLVRGTYGEAFKAPSLQYLNAPIFTVPGFPVVDPLRGNQVERVVATIGGNPHLGPEAGQSHAFGFVYSGGAIPNLEISVTNWSVTETASIQLLLPQTLVNNEKLFPSDVIRASSCPGGAPCPITQVNAGYLNFGKIGVAGLDYRAKYTFRTPVGQLAPSLSVTQTYRYTAALTPNVAATNSLSQAQDSGNWSPRWKGAATLNWERAVYVASLTGRYVGKYQDYDSTHLIGNFWLCDANFRYSVGNAFSGKDGWFKGAYLEVGAANLFNKLPEYSNYLSGTVGYDPTQSDIRGRFLYAQMGIRD